MENRFVADYNDSMTLYMLTHIWRGNTIVHKNDLQEVITLAEIHNAKVLVDGKEITPQKKEEPTVTKGNNGTLETEQLTLVQNNEELMKALDVNDLMDKFFRTEYATDPLEAKANMYEKAIKLLTPKQRQALIDE
jgi:hypothetical protein